MTTKRKSPTTEWLRAAPAAKRLGIPRTTLINRVARGDFKTRKLGDVLFIAVPVQTARSHAA